MSGADKRLTISLNRAFYDRFHARARDLGRSMASIVEELSHDLRVPEPRTRPAFDSEPTLVVVPPFATPLGIYCASCVIFELTTDDGERYIDSARICRACDEEHPRSGRYSFDDGAKAGGTSSGNLGEGNRRRAAHK